MTCLVIQENWPRNLSTLTTDETELNQNEELTDTQIVVPSATCLTIELSMDHELDIGLEKVNNTNCLNTSKQTVMGDAWNSTAPYCSYQLLWQNSAEWKHVRTISMQWSGCSVGCSQAEYALVT